MKKLKLSILLTFFLLNLSAQSCLSSFNRFSTQNQIDSFSINNPSCTKIDGNVIIQGTDITNLNGLSSIDSIGGYFQIIENPNLANLEGLNNLVDVGDFFTIEENPTLSSLSGLNELKTVAANLLIKDNDQLSSINALSNLKEVGGALQIRDSPLLLDLQGLSNLEVLDGNLSIGGNALLASISSLSGLEIIGEDLTISSNPSLVNLEGLNNLTSIGDALSIQNNASLLNITALGNLQNVGSTVWISNNALLSSLEGLNKISSIRRTLTINLNPLLTNIDALSNVDSVAQDLSIVSNTILESIDGLSSLKYVGRNFFLKNNDNIPDLNGLSQLRTIEGGLFINSVDGIINVDPLGQLRRVGGELRFIYNQSLQNLDGLSGLTAIGDFIQLSDNASLTNLEGLSNIHSVGSSLSVTDCPALTSLRGLRNISSVGSQLNVGNNDLLKDLEGLNLILSLNEELFIGGCDSLVDISALRGLTSIGSYLDIRDNALLSNLEGLDDLKTIGHDLILTRNPSLTDISAMKGVLSIDGNLFVTENPQLDFCAINSICTHLLNGGSHQLEANGPNCNDGNGILDLCDALGFSGYVYFDFNQNQKRDSFEGGINFAEFLFEPNDDLVFSNAQGWYLNICEEGTTYTVNLLDHPDWVLTTDSSSYTRTFERGQPSNVNNNFGLFPSSPKHEFSLQLSSASARCNTPVNFHLDMRNSGAFIESNGSVVLSYNELTSYVSASPAPSIIDTINRQLTWEYDTLYPWTGQDYIITLTMPGVSSIGDSLQLSASVYRSEMNMLVEAAQIDYSTEILCAYDPNDKLVSPAGVQAAHYTLKDETFQYTVRFQNTGNTYAIDVTVRDTLDVELDWTSFQLQQASHDVQTTLSKDGALNFYFKDIFLPDSTADFAGSQGFITYVIEPLTGLPDKTLIENTAHIYFDFNPAIITNTTFNTLVDEIPDVVSSTEPNRFRFFKLYPNPSHDKTYLIIQGLEQREDYRLELVDATGKNVFGAALKDKNALVLSSYPEGLYFVLLRHRSSGAILQSERLVIDR